MSKKLFFGAVILAILASGAFAVDLLASLTNGKISDNSPSVKVLSLDEAKQVKGGYYLTKYTRNIVGNIVYNNFELDNNTKLALGQSVRNSVYVGYRVFTNGTKDYYLNVKYSNGIVMGLVGWEARQIINNFRTYY